MELILKQKNQTTEPPTQPTKPTEPDRAWRVENQTAGYTQVCSGREGGETKYCEIKKSNLL